MEVLKLKITENELKEKVKIFEGKNITVQFEDLLEVTIEMVSVHINFNLKNGMLHIEDSTNDNEIRLSIASAYKIEANDELIKIYLDNEIDLTITTK